ncbi:MAG TPA: hypothetical protein VNU24_06900 [Solirubrobacteraceae bacterium]|jgi:hypothetical protein|nr:hypothetical protein [Solirubrobacteraceae bacterium]
MILLLLCATWTCLILLTLCLCASARLGDLDLKASESAPHTRSPKIGGGEQCGLGEDEQSRAGSARREDAADGAQRRVAA